MKAVINFQLLEDIQAYDFTPGILKEIRANYRSLTFFDLDQLSDSRIIEFALQLIAEADTVLFIISGKSNERPYNLYRIAEVAIKRKETFYVMDTLNDEKLFRYFGPLGKNFWTGKDDLKQESFITSALLPQT